MTGSGTEHNITELEDGVREMITERLLEVDEDFNDDADLFEAGLDSMAIMQLLLLLEERFGVAIPHGAVTRENFRTIRTVAELVAEQRAAGAA